MPSDVVASTRPPLSLLLGITLLGWAVAGYAFYSSGGDRDALQAKLTQTEAARAGLAAELEQQKASAGQVDDLRQKLTAVQADLAQSQAKAAEAAQRVTALTADLATRTHERDALQAKLDAAQTHAPAPKTPAHK